ncbi:alpha,alpha-phosphotrehalase [Halalkalibacterium halodurans]|uniref:alpha,alpha-phosphotrehalase n=1 Tax=Halalkalibacterium halodurans TaxID=86665 RepID=UPI002E236101|nr:alpha,alpha-phosphotrehalase [Halalkalibacterium halodurans]MED4086222.1 alpha,alpha-phosphotrehalase [Halalkalibacterium halodurans]MED4106904.1 alpha,alpha-phosphotrehalase [Halalkalibacterium halodurans]MED4110285.1 alpha,alpha-phosphotrehalase [Halalkalibacterium halodurans]MED4150844.1 alpha,alpha-phosphotrehalase [Halalkalibacterium halodurans]
MYQEWWRKAVVYQIYPKSFNDTTGNGVGDLEGIIQKLDYLKTLGVDVIWLTPIYASPQKDNGYDISDYYSIHPEYGTMEDFERLLTEVHDRKMKVIMDIVVNHTSTEHEWFKQSAQSKDNPYRDFYIWKDPVYGLEPNNWQSKFGGSAWKFDSKTDQYYLHLFDVSQADLNWENEEVRNRVYEMMDFWFTKGVDGFRLDVINLISKDQAFPNDDGSVPPGDGRRFYTDGPRAHEFMNEMNRKVFSKYDAMTVGEMSSTTLEHCIQYTRPENKELSMTFNFHHLKVDYPNGEKWAIGDMDFFALKEILSKWQVGMHKGGGWNALFWCNHDQPRVVSRYGNDGKYHEKSAKMLATTIHMMQGTPYIYQGEEFGMTDPKFDRIDQYRDVETLNYYDILKEQGLSEEEVMEIIKRKSRDNSRTPVQWDDSPHAGFTSGTPWIDVASNYRSINAKKALADKQSIFYHYKKLIELRKTYDIVTYGDYELLLPEDPRVFVYVRRYQDETLLVVNHFFAGEVTIQVPEDVTAEKHQVDVLLANYHDPSREFKQLVLRPYESVVYYMK